MNRAQIEALLNDVREGNVNVDEAMDRLRGLPFKIWVLRSSITIAPCGPGCRR